MSPQNRSLRFFFSYRFRSQSGGQAQLHLCRFSGWPVSIITPDHNPFLIRTFRLSLRRGNILRSSSCFRTETIHRNVISRTVRNPCRRRIPPAMPALNSRSEIYSIKELTFSSFFSSFTSSAAAAGAAPPAAGAEEATAPPEGT